MNLGVMIIFAFGVGLFLAVIRYALAEKNKKKISYGELLIDILKAKSYKKANIPNEYPVYNGALEEKDTEEYMEFISTDILKLIK